MKLQIKSLLSGNQRGNIIFYLIWAIIGILVFYLLFWVFWAQIQGWFVRGH